jgi:ATP-dependent Lhr-like helicase
MSATVADPAELLRFLLGERAGAVEVIRDTTRKPIEARLEISRTSADVIATAEDLARAGRRKLLFFANSRRECDDLAMVLRKAPSFEKAVFVHHSSLSAEHRQETERRFADESRAVCVATSTLELGIDIGDIDTTVLYGAAPSHESFLQLSATSSRSVDARGDPCTYREWGDRA